MPRATAPPAGVPVPPEGLDEAYEFQHGSAELTREFMSRFMLPRKQQIGQVELMAELVAYASIDATALAGRRVMHWIDNTSAVAASAKGYSSAIDSARIVHAMHATLAGLGVDAWFEYVRTDANVSDAPSREDMSSVRYALGADVVAGIRGLVTSSPVTAVVPELGGWGVTAAAQMTAAVERVRRGPAP